MQISKFTFHKELDQIVFSPRLLFLSEMSESINRASEWIWHDSGVGLDPHMG